MAVTYESIASTTLASANNSITFSSISASYTDLVLVVAAPSFSTASNVIALQFNGDTTAKYSGTGVTGNGTTAASAKYTTATLTGGLPAGGFAAGTGTGFGILTAHIQNYANTTTYKTVVSRFSASAEVDAVASLWQSTSAINSIQVFIYGGSTTMGIGTVASLYGIKAA